MTTVDPQLLSGLGAAAALFLACTGSALGTAHGGVFAIQKGRNNNNKRWLYFVPVVQAGVLSVYGLIVAILVIGKMTTTAGGAASDGTTVAAAAVPSTVDGYRYLTAGLCNGLACWASGWGMAKFLKMLNNMQDNDKEQRSIVGTTTNESPNRRRNEQEEPLLGDGIVRTDVGEATEKAKAEFIQIVLAMIFLEAIGFYGFIVACVLILK